MEQMMNFLLAAAFAAAVLTQAAATSVPAIYVFGDDSVDVGNNNFLPGENVPKANFLPYGIDFPGSKPTGRFSNGFLGIDYLAKNLGFTKSPPAYLSITDDSQTLHGVNFASDASGISEGIGRGISVSLKQQITNFQGVSRQLRTRIGSPSADRFLSKSLLYVDTGSNDLIVFYSQNGRLPQNRQNVFIRGLTNQFKTHFRTLYGLGGRKFLVFGTSLLGCRPIPRLTFENGTCIDYLNNLSQQFNKATKVALKELASDLKGFSYSFIDVYGFVSLLSSQPLKYGFTETAAACCGSGRLNAEFDCLPTTKYCPDRSKYFYWDPFRYSQAVYETTIRTVSSGSRYAAPRTINQLVNL